MGNKEVKNEPDTEHYLQMLELTYAFREPMVHSAIDAITLPASSHGLDVGCGIGQPTFLLAEAVGQFGHVVGLDIESEFLDYAKRIAMEIGLINRVSFKQGNVNNLPFENETFDWVWSMDCVGYHPDLGLQTMKELLRVLKPGGSIALIFWSSQIILPGYPILEAHLNATTAGIGPFVKGKKPESHYLRTLDRYHELKLKNIKVKTFVNDVHAPFSNKLYNGLKALLQMRWSNVESELSDADWAEYQSISDPNSPDFILNLPDYYGFFTYSLFQGNKE
jgi:demethylmenaquinone methyltransferase/2-methoxy-6-polyprenyl-1,4-benzoquinol methylase